LEIPKRLFLSRTFILTLGGKRPINYRFDFSPKIAEQNEARSGAAPPELRVKINLLLTSLRSVILSNFLVDN